MKSITRLFYSVSSFFLFSSFFIAFCAIALLLTTHLVLIGDLHHVSLHVISLVFASVVLIYNYNVLFKTSFNANSGRKEWMVTNKWFLSAIIIGSVLIIIGSASYLSFYGLLFIGHLFIISFLYGFPLKWKRRKISLRSIPFIKPLLIAYVWSATTVILPAFESGSCIVLSNCYWEFCSRFVLILALVLPFDIRDYDVDKENNIRTIPTAFGINTTKYLSYGLLILYILISTYWYIPLFVIIAKCVTAILGMFLIGKINKKRNDFYYTLAIDGIMMLQFIVLFVFYCLGNLY